METTELIQLFYSHIETTYQVPREWFVYFMPGEGIERLVADFGRVRQEKHNGDLIEIARFKAFDDQIRKALDNDRYEENLITIFLEYTIPKNARRLASDIYFKVAEREDDIRELNASYSPPEWLGER